ncbi:MAG: dienelactone hydrolase family protein [Planctomycetota bacterium]
MKRITSCLLALFCLPVLAEVQTREVVYEDGGTRLVAYLAWDDALVKVDQAGAAAGVLLVHQWMGLTDYEKGRARQLAELGYVAFALDIYGEANRPSDRREAGQMAGKFKSDRQLFRKRLNLGLEQLVALPFVNGQRVAAIGYCFGGTGVLELARSGADVAGVVSFHGGLDSAGPDSGKDITAKVLICHGADDPYVPQEGIDAMVEEFNANEVDWQMISYSGAVHSFTQPMAGNDPNSGARYNAAADARSWGHMLLFFDETLGE